MTNRDRLSEAFDVIYTDLAFRVTAYVQARSGAITEAEWQELQPLLDLSNHLAAAYPELYAQLTQRDRDAIGHHRSD